MTALVIVGAQWGDEGKGKIVDLLAAHAQTVVRYGGGANAGHTLVVGNQKTVLRLIPSGALHAGARCMLGPGVVVDPKVLVDELDVLEGRGLAIRGRVLVSERAHLVLPVHFVVDALLEKGPAAIGTTKKGIGPCYQDKAARRGLRVIDLADRAGFRAKLEANLAGWRPTIEALGGEVPELEPMVEQYLALAERILPFVGDVTDALHAARGKGERILLEGAQGTMLDLDHGTFPYVTSSSVTVGGACTGTGLAPTHIDRVVGISKAYTTRVGGGPFPTELHGADGDALRQKGGEFGAVTGRPRRCGWLDIPVLRHAVRVNGIEDLALTKLDVLSGMGPLKIAVAYELDGKRLEVPPSVDFDRVTPIYEEMPGFDGVEGRTRFEDLPVDAQRYVRRVEELAGVKVTLLSLGAERTATITLADPWRARGR